MNSADIKKCSEEIVDAFEFVKRVHMETGHLIRTVNGLLEQGFDCHQSTGVVRDGSGSYIYANKWLASRMFRFWDKTGKADGNHVGIGVDIDFSPEVRWEQCSDRIPVVMGYVAHKKMLHTGKEKVAKAWWRNNCGRNEALFDIQQQSSFYRSVPHDNVDKDGADILLWCDNFWLPLVSLNGYTRVEEWLVEPLKSLCRATEDHCDVNLPDEAPYLTLVDGQA